jgi:hypothetical protein
MGSMGRSIAGLHYDIKNEGFNVFQITGKRKSDQIAPSIKQEKKKKRKV